jgi:hypothetical protein
LHLPVALLRRHTTQADANQQWSFSTPTKSTTVADATSYTLCNVVESVDGKVELAELSAGVICSEKNNEQTNPWVIGENRAIEFSDPDPDNTEVFVSGTELTLEAVWLPSDTRSGESMAVAAISASCKGLQTAGKTFFGLAAGGETTFYMFDRRLKWIENTLESPSNVNHDEYAGARFGTCPTVSRSFVNEDSCIRLPAGACTAPVFLSRMVTLDHATIRSWYTVSTKFVYQVTGLRIESGSAEWIPPCTLGKTTRWIRVATSGGCQAKAGVAILEGETASVIEAAIRAVGQPFDPNEPYSEGRAASNSNFECDPLFYTLEEATHRCNEDTSCRYLYDHEGDGVNWRFCSSVTFGGDAKAKTKVKPSGTAGAANPNIRDIIALHEANPSVSTDDSTVGAQVAINDACWQQSHPMEGNVYDMSRWTESHPGTRDARLAKRRNPIMKWAEDEQTTIVFPDHHPMYRWRDNSKISSVGMIYVGKFGDEVDFASLPINLKNAKMAELFGALGDYPDIGFESCGSRGEVANEALMGHRYTSTATENTDDARDQKNNQGPFQGGGKWTLWTTTVINAADQLRQRTAWALSQIMVIGAADQFVRFSFVLGGTLFGSKMQSHSHTC